jgi:hypothetical protein
METFTRSVSDLDANDRKTLERVIGQSLAPSQRLTISVTGESAPSSVTQRPNESPTLPTWCNIYEGYSPEEIDAIDRAIVRDRSSRPTP